MRLRLLFALLAVVLVPVVRAQTTPTEVDAHIRRQLDASADAWNRADLDGHVGMNADSVWFMTRNGPLIGNAGTRASLERSFFRDGRPIQQLRFERVSVRVLGPNHALVVGRFVLTGGERAEASGWFTTVWERRSEEWKIIHDHSS